MEKYKIMKYNKIVLMLQIDFLDFIFNFAFKKQCLMLLMQNDSHFLSPEGPRYKQWIDASI